MNKYAVAIYQRKEDGTEDLFADCIIAENKNEAIGKAFSEMKGFSNFAYHAFHATLIKEV